MALYKIRYKGLSDIREMSQKDLNKAGVKVGGDLRFDRRNLFSVVVDGLSDRLREILEQEGTFTIEEIDEGGEVKNVITVGETLDDTAKIVVDGTSGQVDVKGESNPNADPVMVPPSGDNPNAGADSGDKAKPKR